MKRRAFITLIGGAAATWPLAARAQQMGKVWRIGVPIVVSRETFSHVYAGFRQGMRELGYVEGKDFVSEWRSAEGKYERLPEVAAELRTKPGATRRQRHRPIVPSRRYCRQAARTLARGYSRSAPFGDHVQCRLSRRGAGNGRS